MLWLDIGRIGIGRYGRQAPQWTVVLEEEEEEEERGHFKNTSYYSVTVFYRVYTVERIGYGQVTGYCECGIEPSGSIKCG
jgi:hypothetical protein